MIENRLIKFITTTLTGGLLFLVPVVFLLFILTEAMDYMLMIAEPVAEWVPVDTISDVVLANVIAITIMTVICFIAGLVGRNAMATGLVRKLEAKILMKIPGYRLIKGIKSSFNEDEISPFKPVILTFGTAERIGFEIQKVSDGRSMVFLPSAPDPLSGITKIIPADQVTYLDVPMTAVMDLSRRYGFGVDELLSKKISGDPSTDQGC